jgi:hypothetical protein
LAAGTTSIQATAGTVTGTLMPSLRVVNADLTGVTTLVTDTFAVHLRLALSPSPQAAVTSGLATCSGHVTSGHVRALNSCLTDLVGVTASNGNDAALLGVLDLFFEQARRLLQL